MNNNERIKGDDLNILKEQLGLTNLDLFWLLGANIFADRTKKGKKEEPLKNVPLCILARYLDLYPEENFIPEFPTASQAYEEIENVFKKKFSARKFGCLFGASGWSGYNWLKGEFEARRPSPVVERLFFLVLKAIEKDGEKGLEKFMNVLEIEADSRGFNGLEDVFKNGKWENSKK